MKKLVIVIVLLLTIAPVATINSRQAITRADGEWERVKITVTLDDGKIQDYWPYVKKGSVTDKDLQNQAITFAEEAVAIVPEETVLVAEVDEALAKLKADGQVTYGTWDELKEGAASVGVMP